MQHTALMFSIVMLLYLFQLINSRKRKSEICESYHGLLKFFWLVSYNTFVFIQWRICTCSLLVLKYRKGSSLSKIIIDEKILVELFLLNECRICTDLASPSLSNQHSNLEFPICNSNMWNILYVPFGNFSLGENKNLSVYNIKDLLYWILIEL